ncbi:hypothetical protein M0R04_03490 [Candidatus Dojkabacteria bacterium]|nr:hypothetical protein [Candidatus Dojkabacteria bacterium]
MKLPQLEKNAYLAIYISDSTINAHLIYADYVSGRNYTLSDTTLLDFQNPEISDTRFWKQYFEEIQKKFNWEILRGKEIINFAAEGIGVSAVTVYVSESGSSKERVVSGIREVCLEAKFEIISEKYIEKLLESYSKKDGWEDIFLVNLDLFEFTVRRYTKNTGRISLKSENEYGKYNSSKISWLSRENLINNISNTKLKAFLAFDCPETKRENMWANFVLNPSLKTDSPIISDVLRSYITIQLLTILNENKGKYLDCGYKGKTLIVLSGSISNENNKKFLISILDGLEARGEISVLVDKGSKFLTLGEKYIKGIENDEFVVGRGDIYEQMYKIYVCEGVSGSKKSVILTGRVESSEQESRDLFSLYPEFTYIPLNLGNSVVKCKLVKGAYFGNKKKEFEMENLPMQIRYTGIIIDGRAKPVVYGPDILKNRSKINSWLDENN